MKNIGFLLLHLPFASRRAEAIRSKVAAIYKERGGYGLQAQALLGLGQSHVHKRRTEKAHACLMEAEPLFEQAGADVFLRQTREALEDLG